MKGLEEQLLGRVINTEKEVKQPLCPEGGEGILLIMDYMEWL